MPSCRAAVGWTTLRNFSPIGTSVTLFIASTLSMACSASFCVSRVWPRSVIVALMPGDLIRVRPVISRRTAGPGRAAHRGNSGR